MADYDEEDEQKIVDPEEARLAKLPVLHIRQNDLPEELFKKVRSCCKLYIEVKTVYSFLY